MTSYYVHIRVYSDDIVGCVLCLGTNGVESYISVFLCSVRSPFSLFFVFVFCICCLAYMSKGGIICY